MGDRGPQSIDLDVIGSRTLKKPAVTAQNLGFLVQREVQELAFTKTIGWSAEVTSLMQMASPIEAYDDQSIPRVTRHATVYCLKV